MATKIVTKNSSTAGSAPSASDLVQGELAVNVTDGRLYTENASAAIVELGVNPLGAVTMASTLAVTGNVDFNGDLDVDGVTNLDVVDIDGATQIDATVTVGVNDTGYDVKFYGDTSGKNLTWDASADTLTVTGTTNLVGTLNLDNVDIDGAVQLDSTLTVGVNDTGYDVKFYGDTSGKNLTWDASADSLIVTGAITVSEEITANGGIALGDSDKATFGAGDDLQIYHDGSNSYIKDAGDGNLYITANEFRVGNADNSKDYIHGNNGAEVKLFYNNAAKLATTSTGIDVTGTVTSTGTSVFASLDISGDIDVDGTTNLDVVDIDGAVDMASTLQVTGAANFSDRIGSEYVYPTDASTQTGGVANYFWKMGRMTLSGPQAAEIKLYGLTGYGQGDEIVGTNIIQLRGSNSATVLDGCFHATGDSGIGIQEIRYVPIGSYVFDLYVKLGTFTSLSTTVMCGGTWAPEWTNTGTGSNPASSVDIPAHYALLLGNNIAMYANLTEVAFNEDSNDIDFRVESDNLTSALFVNGADGKVTMQGATTTIGAAVASTNVELNLNGVASKAQRIQFQEGGVNKWLLGQGAASETSAFELYNATGVQALSVNRTTNVATFASGAVFNELGTDVDFRVESDTDTHALFVQGSDGFVGIGDSAPQDFLEVRGTALGGITISNTTHNYAALSFARNSTATARIFTTEPGALHTSALNFQTSDASGGPNLLTRMTIDNNGAVTMPSQPAFQASPASIQSDIALNSAVTVILGTEVFDVGSNFASNTFTAPVTGKYQLNLIVRANALDSAADYYAFRIVTSNRNYQVIIDPDFGQDAAYWAVNESALADMDASDTAYVAVIQSAGTVQTDIQEDTTFSGYLVA